MPILNLTVGDLAGLFLRLLPRGRVWPKVLDALQPQAIAALMSTYLRLIERDNYLLVDAFPRTTVELLPEWEATLGLPDPCAGPDPTIAERQTHVVARLTQQNGPSIPSLTAFAAALGYTITITEFTPSRFGQRFGSKFYGRPWAFAWQVNAPAFTITNFRFGTGHFGDRFREWGNTVLQCEMQRLAPAHTVLIFNYS